MAIHFVVLDMCSNCLQMLSAVGVVFGKVNYFWVSSTALIPCNLISIEIVDIPSRKNYTFMTK